MTTEEDVSQVARCETSDSCRRRRSARAAQPWRGSERGSSRVRGSHPSGHRPHPGPSRCRPPARSERDLRAPAAVRRESSVKGRRVRTAGSHRPPTHSEGLLRSARGWGERSRPTPALWCEGRPPTVQRCLRPRRGCQAVGPPPSTSSNPAPSCRGSDRQGYSASRPPERASRPPGSRSSSPPGSPARPRSRPPAPSASVIGVTVETTGVTIELTTWVTGATAVETTGAKASVIGVTVETTGVTTELTTWVTGATRGRDHRRQGLGDRRHRRDHRGHDRGHHLGHRRDRGRDHRRQGLR